MAAQLAMGPSGRLGALGAACEPDAAKRQAKKMAKGANRRGVVMDLKVQKNILSKLMRKTVEFPPKLRVASMLRSIWALMDVLASRL